MSIEHSKSRELKLPKTILHKIEALPALPQVVGKIRQLIGDDHCDAKKITKVIETDQAIATKILKIANSAYYGFSGRISSIQHASVLLGQQTLVDIVTAAGAEAVLDGKLPGYGYESKDLWEHSLAVAIGSRLIAGRHNSALTNDAYTAGLIHDIGKIILDDYILAQKDAIFAFMEAAEKTFLEVETHFFKINHAEIACEVCHIWNFPESIGTAIKDHHRPSQSADNDLAFVLHMADCIARLSGIGYDDDDFLYEMEEGTMAHLGLKQEDVSEIGFKVADSVSKMDI
jgi:putative nucleotidyltransferase with HDIG domain